MFGKEPSIGPDGRRRTVTIGEVGRKLRDKILGPPEAEKPAATDAAPTPAPTIPAPAAEPDRAYDAGAQAFPAGENAY